MTSGMIHIYFIENTRYNYPCEGRYEFICIPGMSKDDVIRFITSHVLVNSGGTQEDWDVKQTSDFAFSFIWKHFTPADLQLMRTTTFRPHYHRITIPVHWTLKTHIHFPRTCHQNILAILMSANRFLPILPNEVWDEHIFSHLKNVDYSQDINEEDYDY